MPKTGGFPFLPTPHGSHTIPHRQVLNALLSVDTAGCALRGLPERPGNQHTVYVRINRWAKRGVPERVWREPRRDQGAARPLEALPLDSTTIRPHAAGSGTSRNRGQTIGRSRGWADDQAARPGRERAHALDAGAQSQQGG